MKQLIAVFFVFFLSISFGRAQNFEKNLQTYANSFSAERIYLHYDKPAYAAGETIWFKAYMMKTIFPSVDSKTVYIDWTDPNGKLLLHTISPIQDGTAIGQFEIPEKYKGQYIHVRAYTKWMLNFDSSFLYNKDLKVLSDSIAFPSENIIKPELVFFPEGGNLVAGVNNKIAFKANDQYGRPVKISGEIKRADGEIIGQLKEMHDGMGYFYMIPKEGEKFTAFWKDEKGTQHKTELPEVSNSGVSMQVVVAGTNRNFQVSVSPQSVSTLTALHIVGTEYEQPVFNITKEVKGGLVGGIIPTQSLPTGILRITVFDNDWKPLAERITFVKNHDYDFQPTMTVKHWGLNKRARNEIEIEVPDSLTANLSVAVTDAAIGEDTTSNIISHLLLTSELKGKINNACMVFYE